MHDACVSLIGQVRFVCPGKQKTLQEIALFFFGEVDESLEKRLALYERKNWTHFCCRLDDVIDVS